jgi:hypothetical protein
MKNEGEKIRFMFLCLPKTKFSWVLEYRQIQAGFILSRTGTVRIQARGDTSGGDVSATSSHVSMNREKFLSTGKEAVSLRVRGSPL